MIWACFVGNEKGGMENPNFGQFLAMASLCPCPRDFSFLFRVWSARDDEVVGGHVTEVCCIGWNSLGMLLISAGIAIHAGLSILFL